MLASVLTYWISNIFCRKELIIMGMQKYRTRLVFCFAFVICLTSCSPSLSREALLHKRVQEYHSAVSWNSPMKSVAFAKSPLLQAEILRGVSRESSNRITEYATASIEIDETDKNTASVIAVMKYLKTPVNVIKTKEAHEKWQHSNGTWFLVETDAFK